MFGHDANHTRYSSSTAPNTKEYRWVVGTNGSVRSSPAIVDGVVYVGSDDGYVYAINTTRGTARKWEVGDTIGSSPAILDGKIIIGSSDGRVHALNVTTGHSIWNSSYLGDPVESSPTIADDKVFIGSANGTVYALSQQTGDVIWKNITTPKMLVKSSPAVVDDVVYIGSNDGWVYAFNATDGNQIWKNETLGEVESSPTVVDGVVFVGSKDTRVYALNATNGFQIWNCTTGAAVTSSPAVAYGKVFVGSWDKYVYAIPQTDPDGDGIITQNEVSEYGWKYLTSSKVRSSPAVADGKVFVGSDDYYVYALNAFNGTVVWKYRTRGIVYSSPAIASTVVGGIVFIGSDDKSIYAFGPPNRAPEGNFTFSPKPATFLQTVKFNASLSYDPDSDDRVKSYKWNFGDHATSVPESDPIITHVYKMPGTYTITLTVTDTYNTNSIPVQKNVTVVEAWPMFRHDLNHTAYSGSNAPITNNTIWNSTNVIIDSIEHSSPAIVNGRLYIGSKDGHVYCLNATNGHWIWQYPPKGQVPIEAVSSSPAVADGVVFVGSGLYIYALNATTGTLLWPYKTKGQVSSSPAVADGMVFVGSADTRLYALNATTGEHIWNSTTVITGSIEYSSPAVADGFVFVGALDGYVYAFNQSNGKSEWTSKQPFGEIYSSPAVADGMVFVGSSDKSVYALNVIDGTLKWNCTTGGEVRSSPAVAYGLVFVGSDDGYVYALHQTNGNVVWRYKTHGAIQSSPAVAEAEGRGFVFVGSRDRRVYALSKAGGLYWSFQTDGEVDSSPAILNGTVFVGSNDKKVYAFCDRPDYAVRDVAVILRIGNSEPYVFEPLKNVTGQNQTVNLYVIVENQGNFTETFNVTAYANTTMVDSVTDITLARGNSKIITFTWNTTGFAKGNYTVSANATIIPGETDIADNTLKDGLISVSIPGDINGDTYVNAKDAVILGVAFSSHVGQPSYNPNADINDDDWVNAKDAIILGKNFNEHDP
jgi:outer membrane protein assembly factor BamB